MARLNLAVKGFGLGFQGWLYWVQCSKRAFGSRSGCVGGDVWVKGSGRALEIREETLFRVWGHEGVLQGANQGVAC